jgi:hypothetical protein
MTRGQILSERVKLMALRRVEAEARDLEMIANKHAARGTGQSGANLVERHERRLQTLKELLAERLRLEQAEKEYPLAPEDEDRWYPDLLETILLIIHDQEARLYRELEADCGRILGGPLQPFLEEVKGKINKLRLEYIREVEIMKSEREHRKKIPPSAEPPSITLNISRSQIAALNVGGTVGTIEANLTSLQTAGEQKIADALKALAEAIAGEASLSSAEKRESLEHASAMGEELARPQDQQRPGVLRTVAGGLVGLIRHADKVYAVYEMVKAAAKGSGYDLP